MTLEEEGEDRGDATKVVPCTCQCKMCQIYGDPHYVSFDAGLDAGDTSRRPIEEVAWVVKSDEVKIQAKSNNHAGRGIGLAVAGSFLSGHRLTFVKAGSKILLDGQQIVDKVGDTYRSDDGLIEVEHVAHLNPDKDDWRAMGYGKVHAHAFSRFYRTTFWVFRLPRAVNIYITEYDSMSVIIKMPKVNGMDGLCGNYDGNKDNDGENDVKERMGGSAKVADDDNLFNLDAEAFLLDVSDHRDVSTRTEEDCDPELKKKAEEKCAEVKEVTLRKDCVYDICMTGDFKGEGDEMSVEILDSVARLDHRINVEDGAAASLIQQSNRRQKELKEYRGAPATIPCECECKMCQVYGDPHFIAFDAPLRGGDTIRHPHKGVVWAVKSDDVKIQFKANDNAGRGIGLAVAGNALGNHRLVWFKKGKKTLLDGQEIVKDAGSKYKSDDGLIEVEHMKKLDPNEGEWKKSGYDQALKSANIRGRETWVWRLAGDLNIYFSELDSLSAIIRMPKKEGMDGMCGNYDENKDNDGDKDVIERMGPINVADSENLFTADGQAFLEEDDRDVRGRTMENCEPELKTKAEEKCSEIEEVTLRKDCVFDICMTGDLKDEKDELEMEVLDTIARTDKEVNPEGQ